MRRSLAAPFITPSKRRDVVRQLRAAAPAGGVDVGEVVFEVDARADRHGGLEDARQDRVLGVVLGRVVGVEEGAAVEEQARGSGSRRPTMHSALVAWPHSGRVCDRSSERSSTCRRAAGNDRSSGADWNRRQRSWALRSQACSMSSRPRSNSCLVRCGQAVEVEVGHRVVAGVVVAADEVRSRAGSRGRAAASKSRTRGSLRIWAMARALGAPAVPAHAPQL